MFFFSIKHSNWWLQTDDIAIVKLNRALTAAELANVAIVSRLNTTLTYAGSVGVALGWGVTKSGELILFIHTTVWNSHMILEID